MIQPAAHKPTLDELVAARITPENCHRNGLGGPERERKSGKPSLGAGAG